ncbi:MAG: SUMF1/EgtB/PvdO family nonheme iron enzyme, partial [Chthoniobacteraceae bacterium]
LGRRQQYRLPTTAEWSRAAGVEEGRRFLWGNAWPPPIGTGNFAGEEAPVDQSDPGTHIDGYRDNYPRLAPTGMFPPNRFGLHDLAGNALEWCADWASPKRQGRVMRGGSWLNGDPQSLAANHPAEIPPRAGFDVTGFRCVLDAGR